MHKAWSAAPCALLCCGLLGFEPSLKNQPGRAPLSGVSQLKPGENPRPLAPCCAAQRVNDFRLDTALRDACESDLKDTCGTTLEEMDADDKVRLFF